MFFYHVTPKKNRASIERLGLDPAYSMGNPRVTWLCRESKILWALEHVAERHGTRSLLVYQVVASESFAVHTAKHAVTGLFCTGWVLPSSSLRRIDLLSLAELALARGVADSTLRARLARGALAPDYTVKGRPLFVL